MERDIQARLLVAAERMGTGLLRTGAALERIAAIMEKQARQPADSDQSRVPSCADLAAPICGNCEDCQPIRGDQELPS